MNSSIPSINTAEGLLNITPGEWTCNKYGNLHNDFGVYSMTGDGNDIALIRGKSKDEEAEANAEAICNAINGTYGKGLDPLQYERVVKALELSLSIIDRLCSDVSSATGKHANFTNGEYKAINGPLVAARII